MSTEFLSTFSSEYTPAVIRIHLSESTHPQFPLRKGAIVDAAVVAQHGYATLGRRIKGSPIKTAMPGWDGTRPGIKSNTAAAMALRAACGRINELIIHTSGFAVQFESEMSDLDQTNWFCRFN